MFQLIILRRRNACFLVGKVHNVPRIIWRKHKHSIGSGHHWKKHICHSTSSHQKLATPNPDDGSGVYNFSSSPPPILRPSMPIRIQSIPSIPRKLERVTRFLVAVLKIKKLRSLCVERYSPKRDTEMRKRKHNENGKQKCILRYSCHFTHIDEDVGIRRLCTTYLCGHRTTKRWIFMIFCWYVACLCVCCSNNNHRFRYV